MMQASDGGTLLLGDVPPIEIWILWGGTPPQNFRKPSKSLENHGFWVPGGSPLCSLCPCGHFALGKLLGDAPQAIFGGVQFLWGGVPPPKKPIPHRIYGRGSTYRTNPRGEAITHEALSCSANIPRAVAKSRPVSSASSQERERAKPEPVQSSC